MPTHAVLQPLNLYYYLFASWSDDKIKPCSLLTTGSRLPTLPGAKPLPRPLPSVLIC
jgi:hypothetical protein